MQPIWLIICLLEFVDSMYYANVGIPGCVTYNNTCVTKCPEHMHRVDSECRPTPSQRTCDEPVAMPMGVICGWSRCDCDFPFVCTYLRDTASPTRTVPD
ncbi:unnamed protein product, partial [Iphiclides podalirius]